MSLTRTQARDECHTMFKTAWEAVGPSQGVSVLYADVAQDVPTSGSWARFTMKHSIGGQATLSGETGLRTFRRTGVISVQIFTPTGDGNVLADQLADIAKNAFEGKASPGQVWFRDVTSNEIGQDGVWFQTNVFVGFEYDEVR